MDEKLKVEKWTLEDGRRAERRVMDNKTETGESERVVELHVEDERPMRLQQRVVEKTKPFVYERKIETIDKSGNVVEQKLESIEPKVQMQLVEHLGTAQGVAAQAFNKTAAAPQEDCDCHVTKEEMVEAIVTAIKATRLAEPRVVERTVEQPAPQPQYPQYEAPRQAPYSQFAGRLNTMGLADEIAGKTEQPQEYSMMDKVLIAVVLAQIVGLGYMIFFS